MCLLLSVSDVFINVGVTFIHIIHYIDVVLKISSNRVILQICLLVSMGDLYLRLMNIDYV